MYILRFAKYISYDHSLSSLKCNITNEILLTNKVKSKVNEILAAYCANDLGTNPDLPNILLNSETKLNYNLPYLAT